LAGLAEGTLHGGVGAIVKMEFQRIAYICARDSGKERKAFESSGDNNGPGCSCGCDCRDKAD